jgi:outer membrane protein assembly factor BamD
MTLICPAFLRSVRWRRRFAWLPVTISALLILVFPDLSLSRERNVEVADDAAAAKADVDSSIDQRAGREMDIGRYYLGRHDQVAAINRFKTVVTQYQTTRHVDEALEHLTELYLAIGIVKEAQTAVAILGRKFPDSPWYRDALDLLKKNGLEPHEDKGSYISPTFE